MNTTSLSLSIVLATAAVAGLRAQAPTPAEAAAASAPVITQMQTPSPAAPVQAGAPNQVVHAPRLPTAKELSDAAAAQGLTLERIEQSDTRVLAVFKYPNGTTNTVAYQVIPPAGTSTAQVVVRESPDVVYRRAPRVVYYDDYPRYYPYPYYWYPPVSVHLGIGGGYHGRGRGHYHR
ncbi:MAG: hypothetical protein U1F61_24680 [Opitutaceae bacterium]